MKLMSILAMWSKLYHRVKNLPMLIACHVEYILMMLHMPEVCAMLYHMLVQGA